MTTNACPVELSDGERYAGEILNPDGTLRHRVVLLPGIFIGTWADAMAAAQQAGGDLPSRAEQHLLKANAADAFGNEYHWSCETHDGDAWGMNFLRGYLTANRKSDEYRARFIRRVVP